MQKRGIILVFILVFVLVFVIGAFGVVSVMAQEEGDVSGDNSADNANVDNQKTEESNNVVAELDKEYKNAELERGAGITPDSGFYFVEDSILSKFRGDLENREKKIAEVRQMINEGKIEDAEKALERYKGYADNLEEEADPAKRDEARRSAAAIRNTIKEIENEIPEDQREEFVDDILDREGKIVTAVEISSKIKALCEQLSKIDPLEYSRVCSTGDNAPNWQRSLDKKLTGEQRVEAEKFGKIMSECFKTSGQQCKCDEIPFADFAATCSIAAPLATKCDVQGDEAACNKLDNLEMPELPPHLQGIMDALEGDIQGEKFDLHMPKECKDAGATDKDSCFKVMFKLNAPEECVDALDRGEITVNNEREAREKCEDIMFKENAPEECVAAGLRNPKECGKLMFKTNAPQECIDAGITGENRNDPKKCEEIMRGSRDKERGGEFEHGGFGGNCREIQNTEERLKCYDGATQGVKNFDQRFRETKEKEKQCAESCLSKNEAWDFTNGQCSCRAGDEGQYNFDQRREDRFREEFNNREGFRPPEGGEFGRPPEGQIGQLPSGEGFNTEGSQGGTTSGTGGTTSTTTSTTGESSTSSSSGSGSEGSTSSGTGGTTSGTGGTTSTTTSTTGESSTSSGGESSSGSGITGGVIQMDNRFVDYFFGR